MYYQFNMQAENHPNEQRFSCYLYNIPKERSNGFGKHCHSYYEIIYAIDETAYIELNGKTLRLDPGDLLFVPPLVSHATLPCEYQGFSLILQFSNHFLHSWGMQIPGLNLLTYHPRLGENPQDFIVKTIENLALQYVLKALIVICKRFPDRSLPLEQQHEILGLCSEDEPMNDPEITPDYWKAKSSALLLLAELVGQQFLTLDSSSEIFAQELEQLKPLVVEMMQSPEKSMTMEQAAQMVNMSYHHFCRMFKHIFGVSFVEYKNFLRVQYAEQLLLETDKSITEISEYVNFGNLSYFNKLFKHQTGLPPSEYRTRKAKKNKM